jgi:AAA ATPase domain
MLGTRDGAAPLLGRAKEQELLASLLDEVATRGQALVLRGEPGIGKSRLLSEAARTARERGMTVLTTSGVQSEAHSSHLPSPADPVGARAGSTCRGTPARGAAVRPVRSGPPSAFRVHGHRRRRRGRRTRRGPAGGARAPGRGRGDCGRRPGRMDRDQSGSSAASGSTARSGEQVSRGPVGLELAAALGQLDSRHAEGGGELRGGADLASIQRRAHRTDTKNCSAQMLGFRDPDR